MLRSHEVAALFDVTERTVINWAASGKLACLRTVGGHLRFRSEDVMSLLEANSLRRPQGSLERAATRAVPGHSGQDLDATGLALVILPARMHEVQTFRRRGAAADDGPHPLDVRVPPPLGTPVGVADAHADRRVPTTNFANRCHRVTHSSSRR